MTIKSMQEQLESYCLTSEAWMETDKFLNIVNSPLQNFNCLVDSRLEFRAFQSNLILQRLFLGLRSPTLVDAL